jgi:hypothetical protein
MGREEKRRGETYPTTEIIKSMRYVRYLHMVSSQRISEITRSLNVECAVDGKRRKEERRDISDD